MITGWPGGWWSWVWLAVGAWLSLNLLGFFWMLVIGWRAEQDEMRGDSFQETLEA